jgi:hypothetical protein
MVMRYHNLCKIVGAHSLICRIPLKYLFKKEYDCFRGQFLNSPNGVNFDPWG